MSITKTVYDYLDNLEDGSIISGWQLFDIINSITNKNTYPSTLLSMCRKYCDIVGGNFECISVKESRYIYHKGYFKIGDNLHGKE